jgi:hypothetical protein
MTPPPVPARRNMTAAIGPHQLRVTAQRFRVGRQLACAATAPFLRWTT